MDRSSTRERFERWRAMHAERQRNRDLRVRAERALTAREMFSPSFPPLLPLECYPQRAPSGALVVRCEPLGDGFIAGELRIARVVAEDGSSWLECEELGSRLDFPGGSVAIGQFRRDSVPTRTTIGGEQRELAGKQGGARVG